MSASVSRYLDQLASACHAGKLSDSAAEHLRSWLTSPHLQEYAPAVQAHLRAGQWEVLQDVFWTAIPFGTAGRRGRMYPIGCNAINERTIGETVQALAQYVQEVYDGPPPPSCAIAYDTRHRSDQFARLSAEIMVAHGFDVLFFEDFRATPLLATTVRYKQCACGIMISASHNPPTDNAAKIFWSTGGQLREPHDAEVARGIESITDVHREPFPAAVRAGKIRYMAEEMDAVYQEAVLAEGFGLAQGARDLNLLYSPLHGVGLTSVLPVLQADGFHSVEVYAAHAEPNGCFPNVPGNNANPELPQVFQDLIDHAREIGADLVLASDPDADRLGCAAPLSLRSQSWLHLDGHQIAALLAEYVLRKRQAGGSLTPQHFLVKTLVTTDLLQRIADAYDIRLYGDCLTGFKWIGSLIDEQGPDQFVMGAEDAHGYLIGTHVRDKDGAVAAMLLAELAAESKAAGRSLHEELDRIYLKYGLHCERTVSETLRGADGMREMAAIMEQLRRHPPNSLGGLTVARQRDYLQGLSIEMVDGTSRPLDGPTGDLVLLETELPGNYVAVRPSGTEPKIKFYGFTRLPADPSQDLAAGRSKLDSRLNGMLADLRGHVGIL